MSGYTLKITPEQAKEMPMVDVAFEILKAANTPFYYRDLMKEIAKVKGLTEEEENEVIAQVYTEINIDGRFACVGQNLWGLKRWYPVEKGDETVAGGAKRPRIINEEDDDDDLYTDEDAVYDGEDVEDFDALDEDRDMFVDEDDSLDDDVDVEPDLDDDIELDDEIDEEPEDLGEDFAMDEDDDR